MKQFRLKNLLLILFIVLYNLTIVAQQVPNPGFEDWSGAKYDGKIQPKDWYASNVTQVGFNFNFAHQEAGHSGSYSMMVQDTEVGAMGITETAPGYFSLGHPWAYLPSITEINKATAGTYGGMTWKYRPDSMSVWIKRTGNNTDKEDFYLLYYSWTGTAKGSKYKGKNGSCTSVSFTDEESDIRIALNANECGSDQIGEQVAEGMWRERKTYGEWTNIRVPIYYFNNNAPEKMNIIFSASNYPNFRANDGLYKGNSLYVDDIEMIYSSKIQKLYIGGKEWKGFNPNSKEEQIYSLGRNATTIPEIRAMRGAGSLTNARGDVATFPGRELSGSEINIKKGEIDGAATTITVKSEDGKSTSIYKIKFVRQASSNANLANIYVNDQVLANFNTELTSYNVELPYGTTTAPVVSVEKAEDEQTIDITQANSVTGTATITVTAADKKTTKSYTIKFKVGQLSDNTLADIKINGESLPGFTPNQTIYRVSLPTSTTNMPTIEAVSAYPAGAQTIEYIQPTTIDGGTYQIKVSSPGNPTPKVYKLTFKLEASSYSYLRDLQMGDNLITNFTPEQTTYYVNLPIGTTQLPAITYVKGENTQQVRIEEGGINGTSKVIVTAGNGINTTEYKIAVTTSVSEIANLNMIYIDGEELAGFEPNKTSYTYSLPVGTTTLPAITFEKGDEYQNVTIVTGGVNGTTRITVVAGNGNTTQYQITFRVQQATNASLRMIYLDGEELIGFNPDVLEYNCPLPQGTTQLPTITYDQMDAYQTVTTRSGGINGDYRITVRSQSGASQTYILHFSVATSDNVRLGMIFINGEELEGFDPNITNYVDTLPLGITTIPTVTYRKGDNAQRVFSLLNQNVHTLTVTAESGATLTYTITFIIQRSESANLKMIYLNGDSLVGFDPQTFEYVVQLEAETCPQITVDKEEGQQVTIIAPQSAGTAKIYVKPEQSHANIYTIQFVGQATTAATLDTIFVNGVALADFQPNTLNYTISYSDTIPEISYAASPNQEVTTLRDKNIISIYVRNEDQLTVYTITLNKIINNDATLRAILINNHALESFSPTITSYTVRVDADAAIPSVSYVKQNEKQATIAGQIDELHYGILVRAANGDTCQYTIRFDKQNHTDATLLNIEVEGQELNYQANTLEYSVLLAEGQELPTIHIEPRQGQHIMSMIAGKDEQHIIVTAESGASNTYKIHYARTTNNSAFLTNIMLNGKPLADFHPDTTHYVDTLAWRTKVVPCVQAIGTNNQIITTYHSAVNGRTHIHVESLDKASKKDYYIDFPVRKSSNTALEYIDMDVPFEFDSEITDYSITLPQGCTMAPMISYQGQEPEQTIRYIARPIGQTTQLIVTAENGSERTYNITFTAALPQTENTLKSLRIEELDLMLDPAQTEHTVDLPYGASTMTVRYEKAFAEQTIWVIPGGTQQATTVIVKSNRPDEEELTYTITPQIATQNPAVLDGIFVDGVAVSEFNMNRFAYIHNRTSVSVPQVTTQKADDVKITITDISYRHWQGTVEKDGFTNTYTVYFHYSNETIPNGEFTQWTTTAVSKTDKPTSWYVPGDVLGTHLETAKAGPTATNDGNSAIHLKTTYWAALAGPIPAIMNLGGLTGSFAVAGGTNLKPTGSGISFHNTPDQVSFRYKYTNKAGNGAKFQVMLFENNSTHLYEQLITNTSSNYSEFTLPLTTNNKDITALDIIIDATGQYPTASAGADLYVDYVRFSYNSKLAGIMVNGQKATKGGDNTFTHTLRTADGDAIPQLTFIGEVDDQAQEIVWSEETIDQQFATRTATITNYAEDGTFTNYTLYIKRVLNSDCSLRDILVDNVSVGGFAASTSTYEVIIPSTRTSIPDIQPVLSNKYQTATITYADSTYTIRVQSEMKGVSKTYKVKFTSQLSSDTELAAISMEGISFEPTQREYTIAADKLPMIYFEKKMDSQTVDLYNGVLTVTAEDGTQGTYTISLAPTATQSNCYLTEIEVDGLAMQEFSPTTFEYVIDRPSSVAFKRTTDTDSVIIEQTPAYMKLYVLSDANQQTYTLTYTSSILSDDATLHAIMLGDSLLPGFNPQMTEYTYYTDSATTIQLTAHPRAQRITVVSNLTDSCLLYTCTVTAENGTQGSAYQITILPELSSTAMLQDIQINGVSLDGFQADSLYYVITLPSPEVKLEEAIMPSIEYTTMAERQKVVLEAGTIGETTNLIVTSEDALQTLTYQILIQEEPSHNANLSNILINGKPLEKFRPNRYFYAEQLTSDKVEMAWASDDNFQTVELSNDSNIYYLHVTAQDAVTINTYEIEVYIPAVSSDATLADIQLNGLSLQEFYPELNPQLSFSAMQQRYNINLPANTTLPEVSAILHTDGQEVETSVEASTIYIHVTAPDGTTTNTYTFLFNVPQSSNTQLSMIYLDGDSLSNFIPEQYTYFIDLPVGQTTIPQVQAIGQEPTQMVQDSITGELQHSIFVTAEDGSQAQYILIFALTYSTNSQLAAIFADNDTIANFQPDSFYYAYTLPVGTTYMPTITYQEGDEWQTVVENTIEHSIYSRTTQLEVTAMSGAKSIYTINYDILLSSCDTLAMIYINGEALNSFTPNTKQYFIHLAAGDSVAPFVSYDAADDYQIITDTLVPYTIANQQLGWQRVINVQAQNGAKRQYDIFFLFTKVLSTDVTLSQIYINGNALEGFLPDQLNYLVTLQENQATPSVLAEKSHYMQSISIAAGDTTRIYVTAEDTTQHATYTIIFQRQLSSHALLNAIYLDDAIIPEFRADSFEYDIVLPYATEQLPVVTYELGHHLQQVQVDTFNAVINGQEQTTIRLSVTAADQLNAAEYDIRMTIAHNDDCSLQSLMLKGEALQGFHADTLNYYIQYPIGTDSTALLTTADVVATPADSNASVEIRQSQETIIIQVTAQNEKDVRIYSIYQEILLSSNALLADILLDSVSMRDFDANTFEYSYYITTAVPKIHAIAQDSTATVEYGMYLAGEPYSIYVTAADGSEQVYTIDFLATTIQSAQAPTKQDVILKHIAGTMDFAVATIRKNVSVALYTLDGHLLFYSKLVETNQNDAIVITNTDGSEMLLDAYNITTHFTLPEANTTFFYVFFENDKQRITSGKIRIDM